MLDFYDPPLYTAGTVSPFSYPYHPPFMQRHWAFNFISFCQLVKWIFNQSFWNLLIEMNLTFIVVAVAAVAVNYKIA